MKLPNGTFAKISMQKLTGYCLNREHPSGKHKAKVFESALGFTAENAEELKLLIEQAAVESEVVQTDNTPFGQLYKVDWTIPSQSEEIILRTLWEVTSHSTNPRLVSAFIR